MTTLTRVENPRVDIQWAGWTTDTYGLQQQGWQISVQESHATMEMRIAIKHPSGLYGWTKGLNLRGFGMDRKSFHSGMAVQLEYLGPDLQMTRRTYHLESIDFDKFQPVDATPGFVETEVMGIDDFNIFRPLKKESEIIIPQQNVSELLHKISELQAPKQDEIRKNRRRARDKMLREANTDMNNYDLQTDIVAQVVTVGGI
jgi:hypothetical protein